MQPFSYRWLGHFHIENKYATSDHHRTRPPSAHRPLPLHLQTFGRELFHDSGFVPTAVSVRTTKLGPVGSLGPPYQQERGPKNPGDRLHRKTSTILAENGQSS